MVRKLLFGAVALLLAAAASAQTAVPLDSLRARAGRELQARHYPQAAVLLGQQAAAEPWRSAKASACYNQACALALAGQPAAALKALAQAQRLGWNQPAWARQDSDLASLRSTPKYATILTRMDRVEARLADPRHAQLVTSDIALFWRAYDLAAKDPAQAEQIYQREYFAKGSVGLQDYFQSKIETVAQFVQNQQQKPDFYRAVRPNLLQIASMTPQIQAGFLKLRELYPAARFPNVYFVVGCWNSGGTSSSNGLLIGADMHCRTPSVPLGELSLWERNNFKNLEGLSALVAHEHIHYIQQKGNDPSLLRGAIDEGMADFLAELTSGHNPNDRLQAYGQAHEKQIWENFTREMAGPKWHNWIGNADQETADKPADLGYFVGYRICQSYYEEMPDKKQAIHDILNISDYPAFLAKSRYVEKLAAR